MKRILLLMVCLAPCPSFATERPLFNRDIRPILSDVCFQCHGPDERQRKAGLRLDLKDAATQPAESGATAIVPGKPNDSELMKRLLASDDSLRMPPPNSSKKITPQQIELLKRWIADGAEYQGHWAFIPPVRPAVPVRPMAEGRQPMAVIPNPIDQFILARLDQAGLKPSPEADKTTLIRRVTLDLTGLPPTPSEVDAFAADTSDNAYEKVVDRLLESPRYGEQMARPWLDMARYADSNGFQVDSSRFQWPWRDWVIKAFNDNLPFDQFTIEQIAGDLLPNPTRPQLVATGFNRNHKLNGEGGIIAEEWRVETVIDRVETTGLTWLGLTLNCCRCHDHKYDPISQRDFYSLFAFFNNVAESGTLQGESKNTEPTLSVPTAEQDAELKRLDEAIAAATTRVAEESKRLPDLIAAWEPGFREKLRGDSGAVWTPLQPRDAKSAGGAKLAKQADGTFLASGKNPPHDVYTIAAPIAAGQFSGLLLECLPDDSLPNKSLGRYPNGNFVLSSIAAEITSPELPSPLVAKFVRAEATYSQKGWEIGLVLDGSSTNGWAVDGPTRRDPTSAMFLLESPLTVPVNAVLTVKLKHEALAQHNIGRFRLSMTSLPPSTVKLDGAKFPESLKAILELAADNRSDTQNAELTNFFKANVDSPLKQAEVAAASAKKARDDLAAKMPTVMVMREGQPREAFILIRGEYDKRGDKVAAALPAALTERSDGLSWPSLSEPRPRKAVATSTVDQSPTRLDLARWIVSRDNPLTARVWVNRAWEKFFGTGLVKTTENLGSQAEYPSHPELLDWLAVEFMEGVEGQALRGEGKDGTASPLPLGSQPSAKPWDMKALQKLIVMSATYRQSSRELRDESREEGHSNSRPSSLSSRLTDPDNRLLSRGPRVRLSAEALRDQALFASGLLVEKLGGPSVRPYMPDGVWDETSRYGDLRGYKHDTGDGLYRRTLYTIWKRTAAPPTMLLFDAPSREICTVKRSRTNTPLQALTLLNEITYVEAARKLAERMLLEGGKSPAERITFGFRWATSRKPTADELAVLIEGLNEDMARLKQQPDAAKQILSTGESKPNASLDPAELAAYTLTANVLLNLDEVVTRE